MHKIFCVSVNVINNLMHIHCLLMIGSVLSNDFLLNLTHTSFIDKLNLIIIGNVLGLWGPEFA
jgi:hypothetical protein